MLSVLFLVYSSLLVWCCCYFAVSYRFFIFHFELMVGQASDSMTAIRRKALIGGLVPDAYLKLGPPWLNLRVSLALTICES